MANFETAKTCTITMGVGLNIDGNIAQDGEAAVGTKAFSIPGLKKGATLAEAKTVFDEVVTKIGGGVFDTLSAVRTTKERVIE